MLIRIHVTLRGRARDRVPYVSVLLIRVLAYELAVWSARCQAFRFTAVCSEASEARHLA